MYRTLFNGDIFSNFCDQYLSSPSTKITKTESEYKLEMSVPGLDKKDLNINTENDILTIINEKQGLFTGPFKKQYSIPDEVDIENISAEFKDGILSIILSISKSKRPTRSIIIN
jgi:HSP20 family protein